MTVRPFNAETDHKEVARWWTAQKWPALPPAMLPYGFVSFSGDFPVAAAFLYSTEASLHIMEWIVGNPDLPWETRGAGIEAVVLACCERAKELGGSSVITTTKHVRLIDRYLSMGFQTTDLNMTHLVVDLSKIKDNRP